jgi:hypothetical protein
MILILFQTFERFNLRGKFQKHTVNGCMLLTKVCHVSGQRTGGRAGDWEEQVQMAVR